MDEVTYDTTFSIPKRIKLYTLMFVFFKFQTAQLDRQLNVSFGISGGIESESTFKENYTCLTM